MLSPLCIKGVLHHPNRRIKDSFRRILLDSDDFWEVDRQDSGRGAANIPKFPASPLLLSSIKLIIRGIFQLLSSFVPGTIGLCELGYGVLAWYLYRVRPITSSFFDPSWFHDRVCY
jgi:hypothetical protein